MSMTDTLDHAAGRMAAAAEPRCHGHDVLPVDEQLPPVFNVGMVCRMPGRHCYGKIGGVWDQRPHIPGFPVAAPVIRAANQAGCRTAQVRLAV